MVKSFGAIVLVGIVACSQTPSDCARSPEDIAQLHVEGCLKHGSSCSLDARSSNDLFVGQLNFNHYLACADSVELAGTIPRALTVDFIYRCEIAPYVGEVRVYVMRQPHQNWGCAASSINFFDQGLDVPIGEATTAAIFT